MKFTVDKHEKYILLKLNETKLNSLISPQLKSELILMNTEGQRNIIFDLSQVKFADSSGLSTPHQPFRVNIDALLSRLSAM